MLPNQSFIIAWKARWTLRPSSASAPGGAAEAARDVHLESVNGPETLSDIAICKNFPKSPPFLGFHSSLAAVSWWLYLVRYLGNRQVIKNQIETSAYVQLVKQKMNLLYKVLIFYSRKNALSYIADSWVVFFSSVASEACTLLAIQLRNG